MKKFLSSLGKSILVSGGGALLGGLAHMATDPASSSVVSAAAAALAAFLGLWIKKPTDPKKDDMVNPSIINRD